MTTEREQILALANELNFPALNEWGKDLIEAFYHAARKPLEQEVERLKTVPMKYRRMEFNAQLQEENAELRQQLAVAQLQIKQYREAHQAVIGCIDAACCEGLMDQLAELPIETGQIRDLVERRLLWAGRYSEQALALPADTSALEAMIVKAGEVMRERCCRKAGSMERDYPITGKLYAGNVSKAIRSIPGVTIADLK